MRVVSWNVLFRQYEEIHVPDSEILKRYPVDIVRTIEIYEFLSPFISQDYIICLQECSIELLTLLQFRVPYGKKVFYEYNSKGGDYVITIAPDTFRKVNFELNTLCVRNCVIVEDNWTRIINCHLIPQRYVEISVLEYLKSLTTYNTIIAGDFNAMRKDLLFKMQEWTIPYYGKTYNHKRDIDFIITNMQADTYDSSMVRNGKQLSDHEMIILEIS
jgi:hypothetical protein